jgi:hypothetical protein
MDACGLSQQPHVLIRNNRILFACGIMWLRRNYLYNFFFLKDELWVLIIVQVQDFHIAKSDEDIGYYAEL